jgi:hypothetical protein
MSSRDLRIVGILEDCSDAPTKQSQADARQEYAHSVEGQKYHPELHRLRRQLYVDRPNTAAREVDDAIPRGQKKDMTGNCSEEEKKYSAQEQPKGFKSPVYFGPPLRAKNACCNGQCERQKCDRKK